MNKPQIPECPLERVSSLLGGKWKIRLLWAVHKAGSARFSTLKRELAVETTFAADATTNSRPVLGTANYLPPELRKGLPAVPASDYYALGVALFRLLTSVWYEPGSNVLDLLAPFSPVWRRIFPALLAEKPEDRSMPSADTPRRRWIWAALAIALALAVVAALFFYLSRSNNGKEVEKPVPVEFDELFGVSEKL